MKKKQKSKGERLGWPKLSEAKAIRVTPEMVIGKKVDLPPNDPNNKYLVP